MEYENRILAKIVNKNFTWGDLNPKYGNLNQLIGLTYCPFHENKETPSAKFYYNEDDDMWSLYCFSEHKIFFASDYVTLILCGQKQQYKSLFNFLIDKLGQAEVQKQYTLFEKIDDELTENSFQRKVNWINNVYNETENIVDYIERLYTS